MIETGHDAFCERCGTRVGESPAQPTAIAALLKRVRGQSARVDTGLRLCLGCRNYICLACLNEQAGVCQSCAPLAELQLGFEPEPVVPAETPAAIPPKAEPAVELAAQSGAFDETEIVAARPVAAEAPPAGLARPYEEPEVAAAQPVVADARSAGLPLPAEPTFATLTPLGDDLEESAPADRVLPAPLEPAPAVPELELPDSTPLAPAVPAAIDRQPAPATPSVAVPLPPFVARPSLPAAAPLAPRFAPPAARPVPPPAITPPFGSTVAALPLAHSAASAQTTAASPAAVRECVSCRLPLSARAGFCRRCGSAQQPVA